MSILEIKNVSKSYKQIRAVQDINLEIKEGEIVSLVGTSGSGKTTLLKIIEGKEVSEGDVFLHGEKVWGPDEKLLPGHDNIASITQHFDLDPHLTIFFNVAFHMRMLPWEQVEERVEELLGLCQIEESREKTPRQLSGGQQQRVMIAKILGKDCDLLLLDEPFSHLDTATRLLLRTEIRAILKKKKMTAIWVTHEAEEALSTADRIIVMEQGKIVQDDTPKEVYERPVSPYVADFFGANLWLKKEDCPFPIDDEFICIRPEMVTISSEGEAHFSTEIKHSVYLGHSWIHTSITQEGSLLYFQSYEALKIGSKHHLKIKIQ